MFYINELSFSLCKPFYLTIEGRQTYCHIQFQSLLFLTVASYDPNVFKAPRIQKNPVARGKEECKYKKKN